MSPSAWKEWIETTILTQIYIVSIVSFRLEGVDWNVVNSLSYVSSQVSFRLEGVDWNEKYVDVSKQVW